MGQLAEVVFEGVDIHKATDLLVKLKAEPLVGSGELNSSKASWEDGSILASAIPSISIGPFFIKDLHIRVLVSNEEMDVELNFDLDQIAVDKTAEFVGYLHDWVVDLAISTGILKYYAGLEPAVDEETRFFSGTQRGPIFQK